MWMKNGKNWLAVLAVGSLWGMTEVLGGEALYAREVPLASVWLTAAALFLLAVGRGLVPGPGASTAVGALAALYKLVNASPFYCHLLGIVLLGVVFDVFASVLLTEGSVRKAGWRAPLTGALSAYAGNSVFAVLMTFIVRYEYWVGDGLRKFSSHILLSGTLTAASALALVPLGLRIGVRSGTLSIKNPRWTAASAAGLTCAAWIAGTLLG